jgi:hypothetical protein
VLEELCKLSAGVVPPLCLGNGKVDEDGEERRMPKEDVNLDPLDVLLIGQHQGDVEF